MNRVFTPQFFYGFLGGLFIAWLYYIIKIKNKIPNQQ